MVLVVVGDDNDEEEQQKPRGERFAKVCANVGELRDRRKTHSHRCTARCTKRTSEAFSTTSSVATAKNDRPSVFERTHTVAACASNVPFDGDFITSTSADKKRREMPHRRRLFVDNASDVAICDRPLQPRRPACALQQGAAPTGSGAQLLVATRVGVLCGPEKS